jgi:hypothetical protein
MEKELTYLTPEGHTVFTSQFLKNRGTCCKTACLHCPYGFTLKKLGLKFQEATEADSTQIENILQEAGGTSVDWKAFLPSNLCFIILKDEICGLMLKNHIVVKHLFLKPHFKNQGLSKEMVESYYFI